MDEEEKPSPLHQQQQQKQEMLMQKQRQQQQQPQQFLLLQQLQKQKQQAAAISRFPSYIDAHLRPPGIAQRPIQSNPVPNVPHQQATQQHLQQQPQQKMIRPGNQAEFQMAYQDTWRVCHPDFKRTFSSLEDACERLLPYHVIADYEAEEDDRILDSDTTGQMLSRSQQWDHNIAAKVAEFTSSFEKQALAFNIITRKRAEGEFHSEERLMIEQTLLLEEKRAMLELRSAIESRERAGKDAHEIQLQMATMAQARQARDEMMSRGPIMTGARGSQGNPDKLLNGWPNNLMKDDRESSEDFLNDGETEIVEAGVHSEWHEVSEFDLNAQ